jgi:prepilin-type N-terminal cleavage/methylation domain-containing protein
MFSVRSNPPRAGARTLRSCRACARAHARAQGGFTLIETMIAALVLAVGIAGFFSTLDTSVHAEANSRAREGATNLAREVLEDARTIPYAQLAPTDIVPELQTMAGLASTSSPGWTIERRHFTYTVSVSECSIDDPKDGYGKHDSTFCSFSSSEASADPQPADLKQIVVEVSWKRYGQTPHVRQVETLTAAGQTIGLAASNLKLISPVAAAPTAPVITSATVPELQFAVSAPSGTVAMDWALEGVRQSPQPSKKSGSSGEWVFGWKIPYPAISDGTYVVSAQAIDASGVDGPPVSISVTLLRGTPAAPSGLVGGFNTPIVGGSASRVIELQWQANSERNVVGYRVYGPGGLVCPRDASGEPSLSTLSLSLSCIDFHPPAYNASNTKYEVVALYHKASGETVSEEIVPGPAAVLSVPKGEPSPPAVPEWLKATKNADGSVTLTWAKVAGASFYRVYRGSTEYTSRYAVATPGSETTFVDHDATTTHQYWVTAVNSSLAESPFVGPVSG